MIGWIIVAINIVICCWDSFAAGLMWGHQRSRVERLIAGSALVIGVVGMLYTVVLVAVLLGYLPDAFLIAENVVLGIPLVCAGFVITVDGWLQAIRYKKGWMFAISLWNSFAMFWDTIIIVQSLKGFGGSVKTAWDWGRKAPFQLVVMVGIALAAAGILAVALFYAGWSHSGKVTMRRAT